MILNLVESGEEIEASNSEIVDLYRQIRYAILSIPRDNYSRETARGYLEDLDYLIDDRIDEEDQLANLLTF